MSAETAIAEVLEKEEVAEGIATLTIRRRDGERLPDWTPGAHVDLVLPNGLTRQYSLCGDRWDAYTYRLGVLREPGGRGGSEFVHDTLQKGDVVGIGGPRNNFPLVPSERYLFVAGGIGITPLLPMIQQADVLDADWELIYCGRRRSSMAFLDELAAYGERVCVIPRDELPRVDLAAVLGEVRAGARVYGCGPSDFLDAVRGACEHWPQYSFREERFAAKEQGAPVRDTPFEVELARSATTVTVGKGVSVLDAIRAQDVEVLSSCRQGTCGTCETVVLAGEPEHRDSILDDLERTTSQVMFPCVSRARSDRLILDI